MTATEENELFNFLIKCASMGFDRSKKQILDIVNWGTGIKGKECEGI